MRQKVETETHPVNMDEVIERVFLVPIREQKRSGRWKQREARIRDYVPMRLLNRYMLHRQQLSHLDGSAQIRWMVQQITMVWQETEPEMTPYQLARGLTFEQVQALLLACFSRPAPGASEQSFERLNFASGQQALEVIPPEAMKDVPLVTDEWGEGERRRLMEQATDLERQGYADDAAFLRAQAAASLAHEREQAGYNTEDIMAPASYQLYDAMRLYSDMRHVYGMTKDEIDTMHYPTFFGYVREAVLHERRQKAEIERNRTQPQVVVSDTETENLRYLGTPARHVAS